VKAAALLSSDRQDWQTPGYIVRLITAFNGGNIAVDPCGAPNNPTNAIRNMFPPHDNGMLGSWKSDMGLAFVNPPYDGMLEWSSKCFEECADGVEVILLCPPRVETKWWTNYVAARADAIAFWHGYTEGMVSPYEVPRADLKQIKRSRIQFVSPGTNVQSKQGNTAASAFVYYGDNVSRFREWFEPFAWVVTP
jgi:hypothetical protein